MSSKDEGAILDQALADLDVDKNFLDDEPNEASRLVPASSHVIENVPTATSASPWIIIGSAVVLVAVVVLVTQAILFWAPLLALLAVAALILRSNMPPRESFHAKQQIQHISQQKDDAKGKGWLENKINRAKAYIKTEVKDAIGGYEDVEFLDVGFGTMAIARDLTSTSRKYYSWLGVWGEWRALDLPMQTKASIHQWLWKRGRASNPSQQG